MKPKGCRLNNINILNHNSGVMRNTNLILLLLLMFTFSSCNETKEKEVEVTKIMDANKHQYGVASVNALGESGVHGTVTFKQTDEGVLVFAEIYGLAPGKHGFHIHEYGDCTSADGKSAGGHYNPAGMEHAAPTSAMRHMGDMGNIEVFDADSPAILEYTDSTIVVSDVIGRGIIVHAGEDDLKTQPTGAAGGRLACGTIGIGKEE